MGKYEERKLKQIKLEVEPGYYVHLTCEIEVIGGNRKGKTSDYFLRELGRAEIVRLFNDLRLYLEKDEHVSLTNMEVAVIHE